MEAFGSTAWGSVPLTQDQFAADVRRELSVACAVPITIRQAEMDRIIKYAAEWFYKHYSDAVEERIYVIPKTNFATARYKMSRTITLPECVVSVTSLKKLREDFVSSTAWDGQGGEITLEKLIFKDVANVGSSSDSLMYYAINLFWFDTASHLLTHTISFNYNRNSRGLVFMGETPDRDCAMECHIRLPLEHLMKDELFYRYVVAQCKMQIGRILGTFDFNLVGDVKINHDMIREEGKEELERIREEVKEEDGMDFFFTSGGA